MQKNRYYVEGMTCTSCAQRVEKALRSLKGMQESCVQFATKTAEVEGEVSFEEMEKAVHEAGYTLRPLESILEEDYSEMKTARLRFVLSVVLTLPVGVVAMGGIALPWHSSLWIQLLGSFLVLVGPGGDILRKALFLGLRGKASMDTLVSLGAWSSWFLTVWMIWRNPDSTSTPLYFESTAFVITFVKGGRFLEEKAKTTAGDAIRSLLQRLPQTVTRLTVEGSEEVALSEIALGDRLWLRPGSLVPVDGVVYEGEASVDESSWTGEAFPVRKGKRDLVFSGTHVLDGTLKIEAQQVGQETTLARTIEAVRQAQGTKAESQRLADQVSAFFIPFVFLLAFLTFLGWFFFQENLEKAVITAATVLLISCPCALGLATPIAVMVSCGKAAQEGLIIRSALALERAGQLDVLIFDKTGTLTQARPVVVEVLSPDSRTLPQEVNLWVNSLEQGSEHPLSRALVQWANTSETLPVSEFQAFPGRGIQGKIAGKKYRMGTRSWLEGESVPFDELFPKLSPELSEVFLCEENTPLVLFGLKDLLRPEVPEVLEELRTQGIRFILASGDRAEVVEQWGVQLGIRESFGGLQPEEKRQKVLEEVAQGKTVGFVGDGINDASALAVASVGFAMGTGTDIAMQSADITLTQGNLKSVLKAILLARATRRLMVQNLAWAFVYNLCAIPLAITGLLSPMLASGAMAFSSFSVVCNSLRLKYWKTSLRIFQKNPPFVVIPLPVEKENPVLTLHLKIQGMTCQNCVRHVQQALEKVQGVSRVQVSLEQGGFAKVESFAPLKASELIQVLKEGGYEASL